MVLFPKRRLYHKFMGDADSCDTCHGRGWYFTEVGFNGGREIDCPDVEETFCECECGKERKRLEHN